MATQPRYFASLARLLAALGDQEPELGRFERNIVPTFIVGDGRALAPPLAAPSSGFGGFIAGGGVAADFAFLQVTSRAPGGSYLDLNPVLGSPATRAQWRISAAPAALAAATACINFPLENGGASFAASVGQQDNVAFTAGMPATLGRATAGNWKRFFIPPLQTLEWGCTSSNTESIEIEAFIWDVQAPSALP